MPFFAVASMHGTWLSRAPGGALLGHAPPGQGEVMLLYVPASAPGTGYLVAPSGVLALEGDPWAAPILPLRLSSSGSGTGLHHPATGLLLSAAPPTGEGLGWLTADRTEQEGWETFRLQEVTTPAALAGFAATLDRLAPAGNGAEAMLAILDSGEAVAPELLQALGRLLPLRELDGLARTLLQRPVARERLALLLPEDVWAARALPRLGRWIAAPDERRHERRCGPELALLADAGAGGLPASFAQALTAAARRAVAPRRALCVVAVLQEAGPYLLEWIAHHRRLGVEQFFLYADAASGTEDGTAELLGALARAGEVTWIDNPTPDGVDARAKAHGHAMQVLADVLDFRWVALLAVDEFLWLGECQTTLADLLSGLEALPAEAVALPVVTFGPSGQVVAGQAGEPGGLVTERFTRRLPDLDGRVRPIFRASLFVHARPDTPVAPPRLPWRYRTPEGAMQPPGSAQQPTGMAASQAGIAFVAHHPIRSAEEFALRLWRDGARDPDVAEGGLGRLDRAAVAGFLAGFDAGWMPQDARLAAAAPALRRELERLLALPEVAAAQQAVSHALIAHGVVLRRVLRESARFRVPGSLEGRLLGLLLGSAAGPADAGPPVAPQAGPTRSPPATGSARPPGAEPVADPGSEEAATFFRLSTCNGSVLHVDLTARRLVGAFEAAHDRITAILHAPPSRPGLLLLAASTEEPVEFELTPGGMRASAHLLEVGWMLDGRLTLLDPAAARFASAPPDSAPGRPGPVLMDRVAAAEWESFVPAPVRDIFVPRAVRDRAARTDALIATGPSVAAVVALVEAGPGFAADALNAVLPLLPIAALRELAGQTRASALLGRRLVACFPEDPWASIALPALPALAGPEPTGRSPGRLRQALLPGRPGAAAAAPREAEPRAHRVIGPSLDRLAEAGRDGAFASFPHALSAQARALVRPARELCVVASARNEGPYLLEWLAHHRLLGVEAFFLYGNDAEDGSDPLIAALAEAQVLTWLDNRVRPGVAPQLKAYGHAFGLLPDVLDFRWALVLDVDEFMVVDPDRFATIPDYLRWQQRRDVDAVALNWLFVGSSEPAPGEDWMTLPLTRRCGRILGQQHVGEGVRLVKSVSRPQLMVHSGPHAPVTDERRGFVYRTGAGELHRFHTPATGYPPDPQFADTIRTEAAAVCHFYFKSAEEWLWKQSRTRGADALLPDAGLVMTAESARSFLGQHGARDVGTDDRLGRCAPGLLAEMDRLRALPGVAAAEQAMLVTARARMLRIREAYRTDPGLRGWDAAAAGFLALAGLELPVLVAD